MKPTRSLILVVSLLGPVLQAQTEHVVEVLPDGTFAPSRIEIREGDTVEWHFSERTDSIVPIDDPAPGGCEPFRPYDPADPNEFTGPLPRAASGIFALSPDGAGLVERTLTPQEIGNLPPDANPAHAGDLYILPEGDEYATMDATWQNPDVTGVFIRLRWNTVQPDGPDQFDWSVMDREIEKAVRNGKLYSLSFKAGAHGTPDWIFDPAVAGAKVVPEVHLRDHGSQAGPQCGQDMTLGSPCNQNYRDLYFGLWRAAAERIRSRNSWYRALAYVKPSGANLFSHENRLPKSCDPGCVCNPEVWATDGEYTPAGLYEFYSQQTALLAEEFPDKEMCYMLIQAGFPKVNDLGEYEGQSAAFLEPLPNGTEQTETIINRGWVEHGTRFVVAHNGLGPLPQDFGKPACPWEGTHPVQGPFGPAGTGCPNPWVLAAGERGHITGFQTQNGGNNVGNPDELHSTLLNARDNSDAIYVELYENRIWEVQQFPNAMPLTLGEWADTFHDRRREWWPELGDPLPLVHRHTFTRTIADKTATQELHYSHGAKGCSGLPGSTGVIAILPEVEVRIASIRRLAGPGQEMIRLRIEGSPGCAVAVQHSPDAERWQHLTTLPNPSGTLTVDDVDPQVRRKFYRVLPAPVQSP